MGKKFRNFAIFVLALSLFVVLLSGCGTQRGQDGNQMQTPQDNMQGTTNAPGQIGMLGFERGNDGISGTDQGGTGMLGINPGQNGLQGNNGAQNNQNGLLGNNNGNRMGNMNGNNGANDANMQGSRIDVEKSQKIEDQLKNLNGIEDIDVIVNGNTALVGCRTSAAAGDRTAVRNQIAQKVKEIDNSITDVRVSESPEILNNIRRLSDDVNNNRPMNNIIDEFNRMFQGISPAT